jgi:DNA polymerase III delta prime subunit
MTPMRSKFFSDQISDRQSLPANFFARVLESGKMAKAYLLTGDALEEKQIFAKEVAQILNCERNTALIGENARTLLAPCGQCLNCKWLESGTHPSAFIPLDASEKSKKNIIRVEEVRELQNLLSQSSNFYRLVFIPSADYSVLGKAPANALLKVLEEPNPRILFFLCAESRDSILATISSRTQEILFTSNQGVGSDEEVETLFIKLESDIARLGSNKLDLMILAEDYAQNDSKLLAAVLEKLQAHYGEKLNSKYLHGKPSAENLKSIARAILKLEEAKNDFRNFIKPRAVLVDLFRVLGKC